MSIRARLLTLVAVATLVPGVLFGLRFVEDRSTAIEGALAELTASAQSIADDLDEKIQGTAQLQFGLSRAEDLRSRDRVRCSRFLGDVLGEYPQYTGILTIDPDGHLFCDSLQTGRELDLNDRNYFIRARQALSGVVLEPAFGRLTGLSVLQIAFPAWSDNGALDFVLLASLNLENFARAHQRVIGNAEILLFDSKGTVLVWTGAEQADRIGTSIAETALFAEATGDDTTHVLEIPGEETIWVQADTTAALDAAGLHVMVGMSKADLIAPANDRLTENLAALAAVSVLLFGGVWLLAELGIRRQVLRISALARQLSAGNLSARIEPPLPTGELGELMTVLNATAASIEQQRDAIEDLNLKLRQAQKLEAVGQLTGGVAHDFNNLLTVILGNAESLSESVAHDKRLQSMADMTRTAAERAADLVRHLLAFARRQPLEPSTTDINELIANLIRLLRRSLGEDIEIEITALDGLWKAMVDPNQLENAILNLALNARDAMPNGGRLAIETDNVYLDETYAGRQSEVKPGSYVSIAISDTGHGMSQATLSRAFDPFFTTKEVGKGSGLGLSMVYGFVKQSMGHIRIYSEPGQGTTIRLYLPRADVDSDDDTIRPKEDAAMAKGSEKILLVEDDDLVRAHVAGQLTGLGYQIAAARNGPEAVELLKSTDDFDLLFTDVVMPGGMNGRELAEMAQKLRPTLPVLFTSGYSESIAFHNGKLDRGVHLLQKPYRRDELASKIRAVLDGAAKN